VTDESNHLIRKIDSGGNVATVAGDGTAGDTDGAGTGARFKRPTGITADTAGNLYVADCYNNRIRKIDAAGNVTTIAGSTQGDADGMGTGAQFHFPYGITIDTAGDLYVAEEGKHRIRKITDPAGTAGVTTVAGNGTAGNTDGTGTGARFHSPYGMTVDAAGNLYVADYNNQRIRKIDTAGNVTTIAGSGGGFADGTGTGARFFGPTGITADAAGNLYVADQGNYRLRKIDAAGNATTLAGGSNSSFADGIGTAARFGRPYDITIDAAGDLYVTDYGDHRIRKLSYRQIN
jgi:sugar lactone lactonase YvrE